MLHFNTDGASIVSDFVAARQNRAGILRRAVHMCFYIECAAALICVIIGFAAGGALTGAILAVGAAASAAAALAAVPGDPVIATVSYILNLVYAVICFIVGGILTACGAVMLISALAALCGFIAGYFRGFLLNYPASMITPENYTLTGEPPVTAPQEQPVQEKPEPKRSDLMIIAEQVARIMNAPQYDGKENAQ